MYIIHDDQVPGRQQNHAKCLNTLPLPHTNPFADTWIKKRGGPDDFLEGQNGNQTLIWHAGDAACHTISE